MKTTTQKGVNLTPFSTYPRLLQVDKKKDSENVAPSRRIQKTGTFIYLYLYMYMYRGVFLFVYSPSKTFVLFGKQGLSPFSIPINKRASFLLSRTHTTKALSKIMSDCGSLGYRLGHNHQKG